MIAPLVLVVALVFQVDERAQCARFELQGPLQAARSATGLVQTELDVDLRSGERRAIVLPCARPLFEQPALETEGGGSATFVEWLEKPTVAPDLRQRSVPPDPFAAPSLRPATIALCLGSFVLVLALRRKRAALFVGAVAAAGLTWVAREPLPLRATRVLEGGASGWLQVDSLHAEWSGAAQPELSLVTRPERAPVRWRVDAEGWSASAAGAALTLRRVLEPGVRQFESGRNAWGQLDAVWTRSADGEWSFHGGWGLGDALGPGEPARQMPPGWLASGLPQARPVLVARMAAGVFAGTTDDDPAPSATWLRLVGFE